MILDGNVFSSRTQLEGHLASSITPTLSSKTLHQTVGAFIGMVIPKDMSSFSSCLHDVNNVT
jgi:hypothetical protein